MKREGIEKDTLLGALARGYCTKRNEKKILDPDLIEDFGHGFMETVVDVIHDKFVLKDTRPSSSFKFRGKRVDNGESLEGYYVEIESQSYIIPKDVKMVSIYKKEHIHWDDLIKVHPDSVEQLGRPSLSVAEIEDVIKNLKCDIDVQLKQDDDQCSVEARLDEAFCNTLALAIKAKIGGE